MYNLYHKINKNLNLLKQIYKTFVVLSVVMFVYIVVDMYFKSKKSISFADSDGADKVHRVVNNPRMQLEPNSDDFHFITSDKGVWNVDKDEVDLYNVNVDSTLGTITSDTLTVKNENMLLEFRGNPIFVLYLEEDSNNKENK